MYVDSVLHVGVHYIDAEGSVFSCEVEQGRECERFSLCCCLTCVWIFYAQKLWSTGREMDF